MADFNEQHVFITGGASGIGFAMGQAFGRRGAFVTIADINVDRLDEAVGKLSGEGIACGAKVLDVTKAGDWAAAVSAVESESRPIDILCNNAGISQGSRKDGNAIMLADMSEDLFRLVLDINVVGLFLGIRAVVPGMIERGRGHVVNTASLAGLIAPRGFSAYSASKFAAVGLSESLRAELSEKGIGVSVLCPGGVQSSLVNSSSERREDTIGQGSDQAAGFLSERPANPDTMLAISVGERVVEAVAANDFYILTHPEYAPLIEERFAAIHKAIGTSAQPGYRDPQRLLDASRNLAYLD
ncbi:MAG: hypothetical protein APF78_05475 [Sphingomonadales bacterium BRH_c3]|nr:MAG: hypothetical protein APF78_05475 [Sphingomonadales bacterium BRH_c3]